MVHLELGKQSASILTDRHLTQRPESSHPAIRFSYLEPTVKNASVYTLTTNFSSDNWVVTGDISTGIPAAASFHMDFTLATANTYNLSLLPIGGGSSLFTQTGAALTGTADTGINSLRICAYSTGSSAEW